MPYFEIGIYQPKTEMNVGTLWRSAIQLGAAGIFTIGRRYRKQSTDTLKADRCIPLRNYNTFEEMLATRPHGALLIGVEMGGQPISRYNHPKQAIYLLGAEDNGLPPSVLAKCNNIVSLEAVAHSSYNVAVAGSIVMYHRQFGLSWSI